MNIKKASILEKNINYKFYDLKILNKALTHKSLNFKSNNERLEFLGDSILNCTISLILFNRFYNLDEGYLTYLKSYLIKKETLLKIANNCKLFKFLKLKNNILIYKSLKKKSILSNALEALLGAIFIDSNFKLTYKVINFLYKLEFKLINLNLYKKDYKTLLQEFLQNKKISLPKYTFLNKKKKFNNYFKVKCYISDLKIQTFSLKKQLKYGEQKTAKLALNIVKKIF